MINYEDNKKMTLEEKKQHFKDMEITATSKKVGSAEDAEKEYFDSLDENQSSISSNQIGAYAAMVAAGLSSDSLKEMAADEIISQLGDKSPKLQQALGVLDQVGIDIADPSAMSAALVQGNLKNLAVNEILEKISENPKAQKAFGYLEQAGIDIGDPSNIDPALVKENLQNMAFDKFEDKLAENPKVNKVMGVLDELGIDLQNPGDIDKGLIKENLKGMAVDEAMSKLAEKKPKIEQAINISQSLGLDSSLGESDLAASTTTSVDSSGVAALSSGTIDQNAHAETEQSEVNIEKTKLQTVNVAVNKINPLVVVQQITIQIETHYDLQLDETWDDQCVLWSVDDEGSTYSQTVSLIDMSKVKRFKKKLIITFENVTTGKYYSCVIDQGQGKTLPLFQHVLITSKMAATQR